MYAERHKKGKITVVTDLLSIRNFQLMSYFMI